MGHAAARRLTWHTALRLGRVSNLPTVWSNVLAGIVLSGAALDPGPAFLLIAALSLFYVSGMYLNDWFDRDIDRRERPERPIPAGLVAPGTVLAAGVGMLAGGLALLSVAAGIAGTGPGGPAAGLVLALAIVVYDARHKDNPLSPLLMGACRVLVYLTAALAVAGRLNGETVLASAGLLGYLIGLTYVAKQETLARVRNLWPLLFLAAPFAYGLTLAASAPWVLLPWLLFLAWVLYALSFLIRKPRADVPRAVVSLIAGISLYDALVVGAHGGAGPALLCVAAFALTSVFQRHVPGT